MFIPNIQKPLPTAVPIFLNISTAPLSPSEKNARFEPSTNNSPAVVVFRAIKQALAVSTLPTLVLSVRGNLLNEQLIKLAFAPLFI